MIKPALAGDSSPCRPLKRALNLFRGGTQGSASLHFISLRLPGAKFFRLHRRLLNGFNPTFYSLSCSTSLQHAARFEAAMVTGVSGSLFSVWCLIMI